jgi:hypothetical protein
MFDFLSSIIPSWFSFASHRGIDPGSTIYLSCPLNRKTQRAKCLRSSKGIMTVRLENAVVPNAPLLLEKPVEGGKTSFVGNGLAVRMALRPNGDLEAVLHIDRHQPFPQ